MKNTYAARTFAARTFRPAALAGRNLAGLVLGPYRVAERQTFSAGATSGQDYHAGAAAGSAVT
jgi:hypothetical protein